MDKIIWQFTYSFFVLPAIFVIVHIVSLFSKQIRRGLFPRRHSIKNLADWLLSNKGNGKRVLIHAASLGEFEHIKPLLHKLKENYSTTNIVTFFSPSGYKNVKHTPGLDHYIYMPFDFRFEWRNLYSILKPDVLIISKHDVWPNQIWQAQKMKIPVYLVNASLPDNSSRTKPVIKRFLKHVYTDFQEIYAISEDDMLRFKTHYPRCRVRVVGDTKYDQVTIRKIEALKNEMLPKQWVNKRWIFLAGSIWPEDQKHLIPAFKNLLAQFEKLSLILVPHEPEKKNINFLKTEFLEWGVRCYSEKEKLNSERILIVDKIGPLADLYQYAQAAWK